MDPNERTKQVERKRTVLQQLEKEREYLVKDLDIVLNTLYDKGIIDENDLTDNLGEHLARASSLRRELEEIDENLRSERATRAAA